jgi:hypothetical protein
MKKNEKREYIIATMANFLNWVLAKHPEYKWASCPNNFGCKYCDKCNSINFMITFYDKNHERLVSNWSGNADQVWNCADSDTINNAANHFDINVNHYMWGQADYQLHKVRFIRVGLRSEIESPETGYFMEKERGWECEVFTGFVEPYHETWMDGPPEVQEQWEMGCF